MATHQGDTDTQVERPLSLDEYARYGRQMIQPEWGLPGQLKIKRAKVAVVGAGGLGCPLLQYLAGAGVGTITIFDPDTVSASNLHRQVLHTTERVGMNKALSACIALKALNPHPHLDPRPEAITPSSALSQLGGHDVVVDATDRPYTRYLVSDASVRLGLPLVSGAALSTAGQWAVYGGTYSPTPEPTTAENGGEVRRACYRCMWPRVASAPQTCDEAGVWGPVVGMVGVAMAGEVLSVILGTAREPKLHLLHMGAAPLVRSVKMRPPRGECVACGPGATVGDDLEKVDYDAVCGAAPQVGKAQHRVGVEHMRSVLGDPGVVVVDTRPEVEYGIASLPHTTNIPLDAILAHPERVPHSPQVLFLCRRGNDSQVAAEYLRMMRPDADVGDVRGGLVAWARDVDGEFPVYW